MEARTPRGQEGQEPVGFKILLLLKPQCFARVGEAWESSDGAGYDNKIYVHKYHILHGI